MNEQLKELNKKLNEINEKYRCFNYVICNNKHDLIIYNDYEVDNNGNPASRHCLLCISNAVRRNLEKGKSNYWVISPGD